MKKFIIGSAVAVAALSMSSCDDFLDVKPEGSVTSDTYFTNDERAMDAIDPIYYDLTNGDHGFGRDLFYQQAGACDIVWGRTRSFNTVATYKYTGDESDPLRRPFLEHYNGMAKANFVIMHLTNKSFKTKLTAVETRTLGEAHFLRGFLHLYIASHYGTDELGVPFVRWEENLPNKLYDNSIPQQRATVMENYDLIVQDMQKAEELLPKFEEYGVNERGRAHKAAAAGYMAKAYAYWALWDNSKWAEVVKCVDRVEGSYGRGLAASFDEVFSSEFKDFWNKEYIFSIPSTGGTNGGGCELPGVMLRNKGWGKYNGWGYFKPTEDLYQEFLKDGKYEVDASTRDDSKYTFGTVTKNTRMQRSVLSYGDKFYYFGELKTYVGDSDLETGFMINKFLDAVKRADCVDAGYVNSNGNYPTFRINFPLMRMAELYLFRAEANIMMGNGAKAAEDINKLRVRAKVEPLKGAATAADLYHERRVELAFEYSDHLFDLKRWHKGSNAELKALAAKELNKRPDVRHYHDMNNVNSTYDVVAYPDYADKLPYNDNFLTFPYPSQQVTKANGALKQLKCWGGE